jgi:putative transposase
MDYRRLWHPGGTYFFTINLQQRKNNDLLVRHIGLLRQSVASVRNHYPFKIHGWVVLPDHMHCIIELPEGDSNFAIRWQLIKLMFSKGIPKSEYRSAVQLKRNERGIWQRRYWEHLIRDQHDFNAHMDYIHINPLKHGLVQRVSDWPYSTFHHCVAQGVYPANWAGGTEDSLQYKD